MNIDVPTIKFTFQYIAIIRINLISFFTQFPNHLRLASVYRNTDVVIAVYAYAKNH